MIYFIQCGEWVKIGRTTRDPALRMAALQGANPLPLKLLGTCEGGSDREQRLHVRFAHRRGIGEWFRLSPEEVAPIIGTHAPVDPTPIGVARGKRIRVARVRAGFASSKALASALRVTPSCVSRVESGHQVPTPGLLVRIADLCGCSLRELAEGCGSVVEDEGHDPSLTPATPTAECA